MQSSFSELEYAAKKKQTRRDRFLAEIESVTPWSALEAEIEPFYPKGGGCGRPPIGVGRMLRMYVAQQCFGLSDEVIEDAIYDSQAIRAFVGIDLVREAAPNATTLLKFRRLLETHGLTQKIFEAIKSHLADKGLMMREGTIVDATIIAAAPSTKNRAKARDPEMHQAKKGNQWYFGMKAHTGVDAGTGLVHSVTVTAASVHDLDEITGLVRADDQVVYADAGYQGVEKRPEITGDEHLSQVTWRVAARKGALQAMHPHEQAIESRKASIRAKVEHPFLVLKRDFGFAKTRYRGLGKNLNRLQVAFASANLLMLARAQVIQTRLTATVTTG